ncbi:sugar ABC transporter ATP-binding protein [Halobacillus sp. MO56]
MLEQSIIKLEGIKKSFGPVEVLKGVDFELRTGEVHALMGENGAGKSTMIKVLTGIHPRNNGEIYIRGERKTYTNPKQAEKDGIAVIHQELNIIPTLTVAQNMFLGKELKYGRTGILRSKEMKQKTIEYLDKLGVYIDPDQEAGELSVGKQQMIEIARAIATDAEVLIMDEPTAALTDKEIEALFKVIDSLKEQGVGIVYISHRMEEIFKICDRITVLRDGEYVGTRDASTTDLNEIVKMMVGRDLGEQFPHRERSEGEVLLQVKDISAPGYFENISFDVARGEILGVAGLMGAGRTEIMESLFGARKFKGGEVRLDGKPIKIKHPADAINKGIGLITEDRKGKGLVLNQTIRENMALTNLPHVSQNKIIQKKREQELVDRLMKRLNVKATGPEQTVGSLSGGNQQKVVIGKWLGIQPKLLILDEPTRGVDIGAKKEIYHIMNELTSFGVAIIMISSELPEVLGMSDRIMVIHEGKVGAILNRDEADQEKIMYAATGGE